MLYYHVMQCNSHIIRCSYLHLNGVRACPAFESNLWLLYSKKESMVGYEWQNLCYTRSLISRETERASIKALQLLIMKMLIHTSVWCTLASAYHYSRVRCFLFFFFCSDLVMEKVAWDDLLSRPGHGCMGPSMFSGAHRFYHVLIRGRSL